MEIPTYLDTLITRVELLINEGLEYNYKMLEAITREDWDKADTYSLVAEDIDQEIGVLCLIKEAFEKQC